MSVRTAGKSQAKKSAKKSSRKKPVVSPDSASDASQTEQAMQRWMEAWPKMVAQAWTDDAFLAKLVKDPAQVAKEYDLPVMKYFRIHVSVGTMPPTLMLNIPPRPDDLKDPENLAKEMVERKTCNNSCTL
jgi:hypothetical protein